MSPSIECRGWITVRKAVQILFAPFVLTTTTQCQSPLMTYQLQTGTVQILHTRKISATLVFHRDQCEPRPVSLKTVNTIVLTVPAGKVWYGTSHLYNSSTTVQLTTTVDVSIPFVLAFTLRYASNKVMHLTAHDNLTSVRTFSDVLLICH